MGQLIMAVLAIIASIYVLMMVYYALTRLWYVWLTIALIGGLIEYPNYTKTAILVFLVVAAAFAIWVSTLDNPRTGGYYSSGGSDYGDSESGTSGAGASEEQSDEDGVVPYKKGATSKRSGDEIDHFGEEGGKVAITQDGVDFLGNEFKKHLSPDYRAIGFSEKKTDALGNEYIQHYDEQWNKAGKSEVTTDAMGNIVVYHYNEDYNKIGESRKRTDWTGLIEYTEHTEY